jgi:hypothetical protein
MIIAAVKHLSTLRKSTNDAGLDDVQRYLPRCSHAEPNCGIDGLQGHWIKDTTLSFDPH